MFCKKCGYEIQEDSDRCPNCKCEINNIEEKNMHNKENVSEGFLVAGRHKSAKHG